MPANDDPGSLEDASPAIAPSRAAGRRDQGPCLYLGSQAQRCDQPALEGGFCAKHQPGAIASKVLAPSRILAAIAAISGILWPYVADIVREVIRWIHSH